MIFTSPHQGSQAGFGAAQLTADQRALLSSGTAVSQQEAALRAMFTKLAPDVARLARAGKTPGAGMLGLLHKYNAAVAAHRQVGMIWIAARNAVPKSNLPDPGAKPLAVPSFGNLPAVTLSAGLGDAAAITVNYGYMGEEQTASILDFVSARGNGFAGMVTGTGLGNPLAIPVARVVFWVFASAITGLVFSYVWDTITGNRAKQQELESLNLQSDNLTKMVSKDFDLYQTAMRACAGKDPDQLDFDQRIVCVDKANEALTLGKANRQGPGVPTNLSPLITVGVLVGLGALSWGIYTSIKRKQRQRDAGPSFGPPAMPRMSAMPPRSAGGPRGGRARGVFVEEQE
jgi:hypothetical protein